MKKQFFSIIILSFICSFFLFSEESGVLGAEQPAGEPLGEGVADKTAASEVPLEGRSEGGLGSEGETSPAQNEKSEKITDSKLPHLYTYLDSPVVEQREVFTSDEIEKMHVPDLPSLFQASGMQILSYGSYGLEQKPSIRGFTDETVRVIVDGICVNNPQYGTFDFTSLNVNDIEKIEIVRGGFNESVSGEGAVAGVIYIQTKKQSLGHNFSTDVFARTFFNQTLPLDGLGTAFGYDGEFSQNTFFKVRVKACEAQNRYFYKNYRGKSVEREHSDVYDGNISSSLSHYFGNGNSWTLSDIAYAGYKNTPNKAESKAWGLQEDYNNNLSFNMFIPKLMNVCKFTVSSTWLCSNRFYQENAQGFEEASKHFLNSGLLSSEADFYGTEHLRGNAGFSFNVEALDSTNDGNHVLLSGLLKASPKVIFNRNFSMSLPLAFKFSGENTAFVPKVGFSANFSDLKYFPFEILLCGYRMIQFPIMDDLYWADSGYACGNPDLKPEEGWGAELTFNLKNKILPLSVAFYTNYYEQKIQWANDGVKWTPMNVASAFYAGLDASFKQTFFGILTIRGNFEYLYNQLLDESNPYTYKKRIMWTPDIVASLVAHLELSFVNLSLEANYTGKRYTSNSNLYEVEPYWLLNAGAEFTLWKYARPYVRVENILDKEYVSVPDYPMPGISFTFGVKCKW